MPATDPRHVIVEILRNAPNGIIRTKLYTSFYLAHLVFAGNAPGVLTDQPIIRTPQGPGVGDGRKRLDALEQDGFLEREFNQNGPFRECIDRWTGKPIAEKMPEQAAEAVRRAIVFVRPKTATEVSEITHVHSRSWMEDANGQVLEISTDLIDDEEYDRRNAQLAGLEAQLEAALQAPTP